MTTADISLVQQLQKQVQHWQERALNAEQVAQVQQRVIADLRQQVKGEKIAQGLSKVAALPTRTMAPAEKLFWIATQEAIQKERPNEKGLVCVPVTKTAETIGMSSASGTRCLENICDRFGATKEVKPYTTQAGQKCHLVYINPNDAVWHTPDALTVTPDKERNHGGARRCACGGTIHEKKRVLSYQQIDECDRCHKQRVYAIEETENKPLPIKNELEEQAFQLAKLCREPEPEMEALQVEKLPSDDFHEAQKNEVLPVYTGGTLHGASPVLPTDDDDPQALQVENLSSIAYSVAIETEQVEPPDFLRNKPIWCVHTNKKPEIAKRGRAKVNASCADPKTWRTYGEARALYERSISEGWKEPYTGIGFMNDGSFISLDQDSCVVYDIRSHGAMMREDASMYIDRVDTYAEISLNGGGWHGAVIGDIPATVKQAVELYKSTKRADGMIEGGRFLTWTGKHIVGTPLTVNECQEGLSELYNEFAAPPATVPQKREPMLPAHCVYTSLPDEQLLTKARTARNGSGEGFSRLYDNGDITGYGSQSEADYALCRKLAYWTNGDEEAIDRLFRQSRLMRAKWERADYRERTIQKAIAFVLENVA